MMGWMGPTAAVHNLFVDNLAREGIKIEVNELQNHCGVTGFSHPQLGMLWDSDCNYYLIALINKTQPKNDFFCIEVTVNPISTK